MEDRLYKAYDRMDEIENALASAKAKKRSIMSDKVTGDNIYKALIYIDEFYDKMNESERREFMTVLLDNVQIYEERQANGQWLKSMEFKLPIIKKDMKLRLDNDSHVETVVLLSQQKPDDYIEVELELVELDLTSARRVRRHIRKFRNMC